MNDKSSKKLIGIIGSPSGTFEVTLDVAQAGENSKILGQLVCFTTEESSSAIMSIGQITEVTTRNIWHEQPTFKGIIKRHGKIPHISEVADHRTGKMFIQSSFQKEGQDYKPYKRANSPSTGTRVLPLDNDTMSSLMRAYHGQLVTFGNAYDNNIQVPFWFKHFGSADKGGAGDAHHIGIFGRTGSGKTVTAANMVLAYAKHHENMSILILDPQIQFYNDNKVLPKASFEDQINKLGMKYEKYQIIKDIALDYSAGIFSNLLQYHGFMKQAFGILAKDKTEQMRQEIIKYMEKDIPDEAMQKGGEYIKTSYESLMRYLLNEQSQQPDPLTRVYSTPTKRDEVREHINNNMEYESDAKKIWRTVCKIFSLASKTPLSTVIDQVVNHPGHLVVLDISNKENIYNAEGLETLYIKTIIDKIKEKGAELYYGGRQANCLVVLDEAHRFISTDSYDQRLKELTDSIIDGVRTTRKYGIGYMFITQTLESLHKEIMRQIRIFAFGYGLTSGVEFIQVKNIINDEAGAKFYRGFIDPASNNKYPFMFYGPISPLAFTGAPLFLEMDGIMRDFD